MRSGHHARAQKDRRPSPRSALLLDWAIDLSVGLQRCPQFSRSATVRRLDELHAAVEQRSDFPRLARPVPRHNQRAALMGRRIDGPPHQHAAISSQVVTAAVPRTRAPLTQAQANALQIARWPVLAQQRGDLGQPKTGNRGTADECTSAATHFPWGSPPPGCPEIELAPRYHWPALDMRSFDPALVLQDNVSHSETAERELNADNHGALARG